MLDGSEAAPIHERRTFSLLTGRVTETELFLLLFVLALAFYGITSRYPGYVHQDTARVIMLGRHGFINIDAIHPPLLPWMMHALETVIPLNEFSLDILAALNAGVGAWAVWRIARMAGGEDWETSALLLYCLIPFATFETVKINHNSILVSLWPLTTLVFLQSLQSPTWRRGVALGALAALSMLAKYYSALLLLALAVAALASRHRVRFLTSPTPYVAAVVGVAMMAPHLVWLLEQRHASTLQHAFASANDPGTLPEYFMRRLALTFLPLAAGFGVLRLLLGPASDASHEESRQDTVRSILIIALLPMVLTVGLILVLGLRASPTWVQPVFLVLPAALAAMLEAPTALQSKRMHQLGRVALILLVLAGPVVLWTGFRLDIPSAVSPHIEIAQRAGAVWHAALGRRLSLVGGDHIAVQTVAITLADKPFAWSRMRGDPWVTPELIDREGLLTLCGDDTEAMPQCRNFSDNYLAKRAGFRCDLKGRRKLWGLEGPVFTTTVTIIPRPGELVDRAAAAKLCD